MLHCVCFKLESYLGLGNSHVDPYRTKCYRKVQRVKYKRLDDEVEGQRSRVKNQGLNIKG